MKSKIFELAVFDLDGTIVNSHETIYNSTSAALDEMKVEHNISKNKFINMIGMHFKEIFLYFKLPEIDFDQFISIYKNYYFDYISHSSLYENTEEALSYLKSNGIKIALLTTKSQDQAEKIIEHFRLGEFFDHVAGRKPGTPNKPSAVPLLNICGELKINPHDTLMIGDTELDIQCGKNAGASTCAVTHGYREIEQIRAEHPDFIIENLLELKNIVSMKGIDNE